MQGIFSLLLGSLAARMIAFLSVPILTRMYSPSDFGVLSIFSSISAILVPFATLMYVQAIPLPRYDRSALHLVALSLFSLVIFSFLLGFICIVAGDLVFNLLSVEILSSYWWLLILSIVFASLYEIFSLWTVRVKNYKKLSQSSVVQSLFGALVQIVSGLIGLKPMGLLVGQITSSLAGFIFLTNTLMKSVANYGKLNWNKIYFFATYYRDFPKYRVLSKVVLIFAMKAPLLLSASFYGIDVAGQLGLAFMVISVPMSLLGTAVSKAYYAEISSLEKGQEKRMRELTKTVVKTMFLMSLAPFLVLSVLGEFLFGFVFGDEWSQAGVYAQLLALYVVSQFISAPVINVLSVVKRNDLVLYFNIQRMLLVLLVFFAGSVSDSSSFLVIFFYSVVMAGHRLFVIRKISNVLSLRVVGAGS